MTPTIHPPAPSAIPDWYSNPSPHVPTIQLDTAGHYVNPEYADDEPRHLRPPGEHHQKGTCGGYAGLCGSCWDLEKAWHLKIARRIAKRWPPLRSEDAGDYCRRVRGRMLDTWHDVFSQVLREAREAKP